MWFEEIALYQSADWGAAASSLQALPLYRRSVLLAKLPNQQINFISRLLTCHNAPETTTSKEAIAKMVCRLPNLFFCSPPSLLSSFESWIVLDIATSKHTRVRSHQSTLAARTTSDLQQAPDPDNPPNSRHILHVQLSSLIVIKNNIGCLRHHDLFRLQDLNYLRSFLDVRTFLCQGPGSLLGSCRENLSWLVILAYSIQCTVPSGFTSRKETEQITIQHAEHQRGYTASGRKRQWKQRPQHPT